MQLKIRSPLNPAVRPLLLASHQVDDLRHAWARQFDIDLGRELRGLRSVALYRCRASGLRFFHPLTAAGSSRLYRQLAGFEWYYLKTKWEYQQAMRFCLPGMRILEVGCGSGEFLKALQRRGLKPVGLEINPDARKGCRQAGLDVRGCGLKGLPARNFDVVCAFQVLEHLAQPLAFLRDSVRLLRSGGTLFLATPNADCFLLDPPPLLDMPPHHVTGWNVSAYRYLESILPLRLIACRKEPLSREHIDWWVGKIKQTPREEGFPPKACLKLIPSAFLKRWLRAGGRWLVEGQGMVAVFQKINPPAKIRQKTPGKKNA